MLIKLDPFEFFGIVERARLIWHMKTKIIIKTCRSKHRLAQEFALRWQTIHEIRFYDDTKCETFAEITH